MTADKPGAQAYVVFTPSGRRGQFAHGTSVLEAARRLGVDIDSVCGGRGLCGRCQACPTPADATGRIKAKSDTLPPIAVSDNEKRYRQGRAMPPGMRLSCSTRITGHMVVEVPPGSQVRRQLVRKDVEAHDITVNPVVCLRLVQVDEPDMHRQEGDWQRVKRALHQQWGLDGVRCEAPVLRDLQRCLRAGNWQITLAIRSASDTPRVSIVVAVWPGIHTQALGIAIDIGSTTIAAQLCDLSSGTVLAADGLMNPQIRYGEDLMSRVSWAMMNPDRWQEMTTAVRDSVNTLVSSLAGSVSVPTSDILEFTIVANPVMHHLFLGLNPVELGSSPFALSTDEAVEEPAATLGLEASPSARVYVLPCVAGHVGADTAGVMLAERPDQGDAVTLLVDVGTNAEIVLGNRHRLLACSSPTGPAFEGAQISGGQRAAPGAIERVRIDPVTFEPRLRIIGCELWSDQPGFVGQLGEQRVSGICGSGIIEAVAQLFLCGLVGANGVIAGPGSDRIVAQGRTYSYRLYGEGPDALMITQNDVRAIQLAKAALNAGIKLLMQRLQVNRVDRIRLAGAFGSHIDVLQAMVLGMLPDCEPGQVSAAGNAAGTGARIALLDQEARPLIEGIVKRIEKIETAVEPAFQELFVEAMSIPHNSDSYPSLRSVITLPEPCPPGASPRSRRGQRRRRNAQATG